MNKSISKIWPSLKLSREGP